jgi:membrane fusion protein, multidrug efflux system
MTVPPTSRPKWFGRPLFAGLVVLGAAVAVLAWHFSAAEPSQQAPRASPPGVPVSAAVSSRATVPVYLHGLGTVQAFNSVLVRARVDGTVMSFAVAEGQDVKKDALIAVIDPRPYQVALDAALAKKAQDEALLANAKRDLGRYASLAQKDFASHQQVDTQKSAVDQGTATLQGDDAAIQAAQLNLSFAYIRSPIDGRVGLRLVDEGNLVHAADASGIVTITQVQPISVVFTLPQANLPKITQAMATQKLEVSALAPDSAAILGTGELLTADNAIDTTTGTIKLKATFPNAQRTLWPGQFVEARLSLPPRTDVVTVPTPAVQHGPNGLYVYLIKPDMTVGLQPVTVDQDDGTTSVVTTGLQPGQQVVLSGQSRLQNGSKISIRNTDNHSQDAGSDASGAPTPSTGSGG